MAGQAAEYDDAVCAATRRILGTCLTDYRQAIAQLSGGRSRAAGIPRVSAADVLAELVAHLPEGSLPLLDDVEVTTTAVRLRGTADDYGKLAYRVPNQPSLDGNTVDLDAERVQFADNALHFEAGMTVMSSQIKSMLAAITSNS